MKMTGKRAVIILGVFIVLIKAAAEEHRSVHLSLEDALSRAVSSSKSLERLRMEAEGTTLSRKAAFRDYLPTLTAGARFDDTVIRNGPDSRFRELRVSVIQPLTAGGTRKKTRDALLIRRKTLFLEHLEEERSIRTDTHILFISVLILKEKLGSALKNLSVMEEEYRLGKKEFALGELTRLQLLGVKGELEKHRIALEDLRIELESSLFMLATLTGLDPAAQMRIEGALDSNYRGIQIPENPERFIAQALRSNSALKSIALHREALEVEQTSRVQSLIPRISVETRFYASGNSFPLFDPGVDISLTVSFQNDVFPISAGTGFALDGEDRRSRNIALEGSVYPSFRNRLEKEQLTREERLLSADEEAALEDTEHRVRMWMMSYGQMKKKVFLAEEALTLARESAGVAEMKLNLGEIERLEYLKTLSRVAEMELSLLDTIHLLKRMEGDFEELLGIGFGSLADFIRTVPGGSE